MYCNVRFLLEFSIAVEIPVISQWCLLVTSFTTGVSEEFRLACRILDTSESPILLRLTCREAGEVSDCLPASLLQKPKPRIETLPWFK